LRAIRIGAHGGPDAMRLEDVPDPIPKSEEVLVRHAAIGVNFIDVYHRNGLYPAPAPTGLGLEAAGVVEALGSEVEGFAVGDRVAYASGPIGAYAEKHAVPADKLVALPSDVSEEAAAAIMLKGMTARYLLRKTFPVAPGHVAVVHAAAGGVGQILTQWATWLGATVIAVVGSEAKATLARDLGAAHVLTTGPGELSSAVRALTGGEGADVVYDGVGKDTFLASLDCLRPLGMMVSFGNASGPAPEISPILLSQKGSLFLTRPTLFHYTRTRALLRETADDLFAAVRQGAVRIASPTRYALADAERAHRDLEARHTTGSVVLIP
jgi:NADPH:quinone reductase